MSGAGGISNQHGTFDGFEVLDAAVKHNASHRCHSSPSVSEPTQVLRYSATPIDFSPINLRTTAASELLAAPARITSRKCDFRIRGGHPRMARHLCRLLNRGKPSKSISTHAAAPMRDFPPQLQADLPGPASVAKIIRFAAPPNHPYNISHPVPRRGALAIVTDVGAGCGGRGSVRRERCSQGGLP
jgi:hypothetical protein